MGDELQRVAVLEPEGQRHEGERRVGLGEPGEPGLLGLEVDRRQLSLASNRRPR